MKRRVFVTVLCLITSVQLLADWIETGNWTNNDKYDSLIALNFLPSGGLFLALRDGDEVAVAIAEWDYKPENCRTDKVEKADRDAVTRKTIDSGNILIVTAIGDCCLNAERVGENLILSKVWVKGDDPFISRFCADFVLSRE